jgi:putative nucleotidyltransferase with HDIG domain
LDLTELLYRYIANGLKIGQIVNGDKALEDSTYYHSINTAIYSMFIAKWLDLSAPIIKKIIQSGLLHDIGKAKVPDEILNKKGPLDRREMTIIQNHPIYGYEMIEHFHEIDPEIKSAILQHHQRLDGSGYPLDINSDCIGLYARIVAVADVFDAMTSDRVYKKRVEPYAAFQMFKTIGQNLFDKKVVNILIQNLDIKRNLDYRISSASLIGDANATVTRSLVKYSL